MSSQKGDEFTVFTPEVGDKPFEPAAPSEDERFPLHTHFWDALDPALKKDFDKMVHHRVIEHLSKNLEQERNDIFIKAKDEAREEALKQVEQELQKVREFLNRISLSLTSEKEHILRTHEEIWCRAMGHLLKRFLVPHSQLVVETLRRWIDESMEGFQNKAKMRIHIASDEFEFMSAMMGSLTESRWEVVKDDTVKTGEVFCECDAGGVLFSPLSELERLESWIDEFKHLGDSSA